MSGSKIVVAFAGVVLLHALIQVFCLWTGAAGLVLYQPLAVAVLVLAAAVSCFFAGRFLERGGLPDAAHVAAEVWSAECGGTLRRAGPGFFVRLRPAPWREIVAYVFAVAFAASLVWCGWVYLRLWVIALQRSPADWDGLYYHIPAMHGWALAGHVTWIEEMPELPLVNGYPMGVELCSFFMHRVFRTSQAVDGGNLWYWPLAITGLGVIAAHLGARGVWSWVTGGLIFGAPIFVSQSVTCYIDPGFGSAVIAAVAASLTLVFQGERPPWRCVVLWGAGMGLMAGAKGTGATFCVVLAACVVGVVMVSRPRKAWAWWIGRLFAGGLLLLAVGGFWHMRNLVKTGNPVYPVHVQIGSHVLFQSYFDPKVMLAVNLPPWLERYPAGLRMFVSWLQLDAPIVGYDKAGGLGYIWIAGCIPAFLYLWVRQTRRHWRTHTWQLAFLSVAVLLLLLAQPARWWGRLTVWLHALGLPCLGVVLEESVYRLRRNAWHLLPVGAGIVLLGAAVWESRAAVEYGRKHDRRPKGQPGRGAYLSTLEAVFPAWAKDPDFLRFWGARQLARSRVGRIGMLLHGTLCMPLGRRRMYVLPAQPDEADLGRLRERGVEWVLWDTVEAGPVPEILRRAAAASYRYSYGPGASFTLMRLGAAP